ncbi:MAG TPA: L,D-transpeptidase family protein, partial [Flavobacteriales bacterium]|nr:L,D-transpeptidase family protein [Flavobacteriales bacterium]
MRIGLPALLLALLSPFTLSCQTAAGPAPSASVADAVSPAPTPALDRLVDSLHIHRDSVWFHVDKSARTFEVYGGRQVLKTYPCVLGERPEGDKMQQGDRRTPEGTFTFRSKRRPHKWHVFVWIDYPNAESWRRFKERQRQGLIPEGADIGGEVGIHGVPEGKDAWITEGADWTW